MSNNLKQNILDAVRGGYQPIHDPSKQTVDWSKLPTTGSRVTKLPKISNLIKVDKGDVVLTPREYNDILTKIRYLEGRNERLSNVNKHLEEEIQSLQKQLLSKKLRKARFICKLRGKC